jgi:hypothetical protein
VPSRRAPDQKVHASLPGDGVRQDYHAMPAEQWQSASVGYPKSASTRTFLLGHSSIQTTERYLGSEQEIEIAVNDNLGL